MSDENGSGPHEQPGGVYEEMLAQVPRLREELIELEDERDQMQMRHREELRGLDEKKRKIESVLKVMSGDTPQRRGRRQDPKPKSVPANIMLPVLDGILAIDEELFTSRDVFNKIGELPWAESRAYSAFNLLREMEFIGLAGRTGRPPSRTYRILDRQVGEKYREALVSGTAESSATRSAGPAPRAIQRVVAGLRQMGQVEFTVTQVQEALGDKSRTTVRQVLTHLEETSVITKSGHQQSENGGRPRTLYRLEDEEALAELAANEA